ncbi:MAG: hypothetical protein IT452_00430 [Planctomycetia bacterium]|nr:hypothetical protein [Planctomycetia bacterium]
MATVTRVIDQGPDTRSVSGPALDAVIQEVLRPVPPLMRRLMSRHLDRALAAVRAAFSLLEPFQKRDPYLALVAGAVRCIDRAENRVQEIESHLGIQEAALRFASSAVEREAVYLETCRFLRRTPAQLRGDKAAFSRFMDWEAIVELARRAQRGARRYQQTLVFLAARALARCGPDRGRTAADVMERTGFTDIFQREIQQRLPVHLEREWIDAVVAILRAHRNPKKGVPIDPGILHALAVRAQNPWSDVWVQCGALYAWLLASPQDALRLARQRLRSPDPRIRDDIFVRRFLVEKAEEVLDENGSMELIQSALVGPDPSPHVRQGAILALGNRDPEKSWPVLREHVLMREDWDPVPEVRASINLVLARWAVLPRGADIALQEWRLFFERETDRLPLAVAVKHAGNALEHLVGFGQLDPRVAEQFVLELLEKAVQKGWALPVRASIEEMLERVRVAALPGFSAFRDQVVSILFESNREDQVDVAVDDPAVTDEIFGRFLAWLSRRHYGLYAMKRGKGWRVTVGHQRRWRLWRWIHETLNPAPDKRQAISHVRARRYEGTIRAHAWGLGEESPTKVPGEPIQMPAEGGWRRFLPLPDDFLDSLEFGQVRVFSSEGIVTITPPAAKRAVWKLRWRMARDYPALAALREQARYGNAEAPPNAYIEKLRTMGFRVDFQPHAPPELSLALPYFVEAPPVTAAAATSPTEAPQEFAPASFEGAAPAIDGFTPPSPEDLSAASEAPAAQDWPAPGTVEEAPQEPATPPPEGDVLALPGEQAAPAEPELSLPGAAEDPSAGVASALDAWDAPAPEGSEALALPPAEPPRDPLDELAQPPAEPPRDPLDDLMQPPPDEEPPR